MDGNTFAGNRTAILTYTGAPENASQATLDARAVDVLEALRGRGLCLLAAGNDFYLIRDLLYRRRQSRRITRKALAKSSGLSVNAIRTLETRAGDCSWRELLQLLRGVQLDTTVDIDTNAFDRLTLSASALSTLKVFTDRCAEHETATFRGGGAETLRVHNGGSYFSITVWTDGAIREGWEIEGSRPRIVPWSGDHGPAFCQALTQAEKGVSPWRERIDLEVALADAEMFLKSLGRFHQPRQSSDEIDRLLRGAVSDLVSSMAGGETGSADDAFHNRADSSTSDKVEAKPHHDAAFFAGLIEVAPMVVKLARGAHRIIGDRFSEAELTAYHAVLWQEHLEPYCAADPLERSGGQQVCSSAFGALELVRLAFPVGSVPRSVCAIFEAIVAPQLQAAATMLSVLEELRNGDDN